jgi:hypothetical protein
MVPNTIAFVLGNGVSRKSINANNLKEHGTVYGCNAIYREFDPHYLIAVDTKMVVEIVNAGYHHTKKVWTNHNRAYDRYSNLNYFEPSKGWSSGPTALDMASNHNHRIIYILGFDYVGNGNLVNNIYAGTANYKSKDQTATYYGNWLRQSQTVIKKNVQIEYIRVVEENGFVPKEFVNLKNLNHISIEDFKKIFNL